MPAKPSPAKSKSAPPADVDAYIAGFPPATQACLEEVRRTIAASAPDAVECISYGMPAFKLGRVLVYFAGYARHVGFYPSGTGIDAFQQRFQGLIHSKGAVQFPLDAPMPLDLVREITIFRVAEETAHAGKVSPKARRKGP